VHLKPITVASLGKDARPEHFEISAGKAYIFDSAAVNALQIVNLTDGDIRKSTAQTKQLGQIVATAIAADGGGIYVLTSKPGVWLYHFATDTITEQSTTSGSWPPAAGIASYGSNIYLLTDKAVDKYMHVGTHFSPKILYLGLDTGASQAVSSMTIDGSVYLASSSTLQRYMLGVLKQSAPMPPTLTGLTGLRTAGKQITGVAPKTNRIGVWSAGTASIQFSKQIALPSGTHVYDASVDPTSNVLYALADNRLVRLYQ
jgi:hypothetical protein